MADTVFGKILRGEIPCHKVFEDERVLAFLDVSPISRGHVLVIPKEPAVTLDSLSDDASAAIGRVLPRIAAASPVVNKSSSSLTLVISRLTSDVLMRQL